MSVFVKEIEYFLGWNRPASNFFKTRRKFVEGFDSQGHKKIFFEPGKSSVDRLLVCDIEVSRWDVICSKEKILNEFPWMNRTCSKNKVKGEVGVYASV